MGKVFQIREETRKRCQIIMLNDKQMRRFVSVSTELFHFLYGDSKINFSLFIRVGNEAVEYIKPGEYSDELLNQVYEATRRDGAEVAVWILQSEYDRFESYIANVRQKKIQVLVEKHPELDRKVIEVFSNLSGASQMVIRGGITPAVAQRVKMAAAFAVGNLLDSDLAVGTLSRMVIADPTLYDHSAAVAMLASVIAARMLAKPMGIKESETVAQGALYHDVGKTCVPTAILNKPGKFSDSEFEVMKTHTTLGFEELSSCIAAGAPINQLSARIAHEHHEKFDGTGYPRGLRGRFEEDQSNGIHIYARIVAIADVYSALLMKRVYKPAYDAQDAVKMMAQMQGHFDPDLFSTFLKGVVQSLNVFQNRRDSKGRILYFDEEGELRERCLKKGS